MLQAQSNEQRVSVGGYEEEKLLDILRKTWRKMSGNGHAAALKLNYTPELLAVIQKALDKK